MKDDRDSLKWMVFTDIAVHEAGHALFSSKGFFVHIIQIGDSTEGKCMTYQLESFSKTEIQKIGLAGAVANCVVEINGFKPFEIADTGCGVADVLQYLKDEIASPSESDWEGIGEISEAEIWDLTEEIIDKLRADWNWYKSIVSALLDSYQEIPDKGQWSFEAGKML